MVAPPYWNATMHSLDPPYHQQQILRSLPGWTRHLHPTHTQRLLRRAHREHIKPDGQFADWFVQASPVRQAELREAIKQRTISSKALAKALQDMRGITEFCEPLLKARLGVQVSVTEAQFKQQPFTQMQEGASRIQRPPMTYPTLRSSSNGLPALLPSPACSKPPCTISKAWPKSAPSAPCRPASTTAP